MNKKRFLPSNKAEGFFYSLVIVLIVVIFVWIVRRNLGPSLLPHVLLLGGYMYYLTIGWIERDGLAHEILVDWSIFAGVGIVLLLVFSFADPENINSDKDFQVGLLFGCIGTALWLGAVSGGWLYLDWRKHS
ncbi:MAG: hypothetical protein KC421_03810 [Anaerolineales bacterium]|nr:hypothetical protein [Anaerolineales bacterium]